MPSLQTICPACGKPLERLRVVQLDVEGATDVLRDGVLVAFSCPHCAVTISTQVLSALG